MVKQFNVYQSIIEFLEHYDNSPVTKEWLISNYFNKKKFKKYTDDTVKLLLQSMVTCGEFRGFGTTPIVTKLADVQQKPDGTFNSSGTIAFSDDDICIIGCEALYNFLYNDLDGSRPIDAISRGTIIHYDSIKCLTELSDANLCKDRVKMPVVAIGYDDLMQATGSKVIGPLRVFFKNYDDDYKSFVAMLQSYLQNRVYMRQYISKDRIAECVALMDFFVNNCSTFLCQREEGQGLYSVNEISLLLFSLARAIKMLRTFVGQKPVKRDQVCVKRYRLPKFLDHSNIKETIRELFKINVTNNLSNSYRDCELPISSLINYAQFLGKFTLALFTMPPDTLAYTFGAQCEFFLKSVFDYFYETLRISNILDTKKWEGFFEYARYVRCLDLSGRLKNGAKVISHMDFWQDILLYTVDEDGKRHAFDDPILVIEESKIDSTLASYYETYSAFSDEVYPLLNNRFFKQDKTNFSGCSFIKKQVTAGTDVVGVYRFVARIPQRRVLGLRLQEQEVFEVKANDIYTNFTTSAFGNTRIAEDFDGFRDLKDENSCYKSAFVKVQGEFGDLLEIAFRMQFSAQDHVSDDRLHVDIYHTETANGLVLVPPSHGVFYESFRLGNTRFDSNLDTFDFIDFEVKRISSNSDKSGYLVYNDKYACKDLIHLLTFFTITEVSISGNNESGRKSMYLNVIEQLQKPFCKHRKVRNLDGTKTFMTTKYRFTGYKNPENKLDPHTKAAVRSCAFPAKYRDCTKLPSSFAAYKSVFSNFDEDSIAQEVNTLRAKLESE